MEVKKLTLRSPGFPEKLKRITSPPKELFLAGADIEELLSRPCVAIVGSRKVSTYGRQTTTELARQLAERGIVIVSGLALGVDGIAHQAALDVDGRTVAVLPRGLDKIYPASHSRLAKKIIDGGGMLVTEYPDNTEIFKPNFVARNRLIAGLAEATLITEAAEKSGSLHTARYALEQGKHVLAVPGNVTSPTSAGTNNLIKAGAIPVTSYLDVLHALGLEDTKAAPKKVIGRTEAEQQIIKLLADGVGDGELLLQQSKLPIDEFNQALTMLEISGYIRPLGANQWAID